MKLYTLSECYTPNDRGAEGFITDVFLYKSKEEAFEKMKKLVADVTEADVDFLENHIACKGDTIYPTGVTIVQADAYDYERNNYTWKLKEHNIEL